MNRRSGCGHGISLGLRVVRRGKDYTSVRHRADTMKSGTQSLLYASYLFGRVVVNEADTEKAAVLLDFQALGEVKGVVIAVPSEDAQLAEAPGQFCGVAT